MRLGVQSKTLLPPCGQSVVTSDTCIKRSGRNHTKNRDKALFFLLQETSVFSLNHQLSTTKKSTAKNKDILQTLDIKLHDHFDIKLYFCFFSNKTSMSPSKHETWKCILIGRFF